MECNANANDSIPLCTLCARQLRGPEETGNVEKPFNCALCFGVLDEKFVDEVVAKVEHFFKYFRITYLIITVSFSLYFMIFE